jgi:hypothetical protein
MKPTKEIFHLPVHDIDDISVKVTRSENGYQVKTWNKRYRTLETTIAYYEKIVEELKKFREK